MKSYGAKFAAMRRKLIRGAALAVLGAVFSQSAPAQSTSGEGATLTIASYGGFLDTVFKGIAKPFEDSRKITIRWVPGAASENAAKVAATKGSSEFDLIMTDTVSHRLGSKQGLFAAVDPAIVTNYADLYQQGRAPNGDGAGLGFYYAGLFYRKDEFAKRGWTPPQNWQDIFRPEFCGVIGLLHPNISYAIQGILMLVGGDPKRMEEGIAAISKLKNCVSVLEPSASKLEEKIQLGEYLVGVHGNIRIIPLIQKNQNLVFVLPKEGAILAGAIWAPVKSSKNLKLAQEFINWMISPESQKIMMEKTFFGPTNSKVVVSPELVALGVPSLQQMGKMLLVDQEYVENNRRNWIRQIERAFAL